MFRFVKVSTAQCLLLSCLYAGAPAQSTKVNPPKNAMLIFDGRKRDEPDEANKAFKELLNKGLWRELAVAIAAKGFKMTKEQLVLSSSVASDGISVPLQLDLGLTADSNSGKLIFWKYDGKFHIRSVNETIRPNFAWLNSPVWISSAGGDDGMGFDYPGQTPTETAFIFLSEPHDKIFADIVVIDDKTGRLRTLVPDINMYEDSRIRMMSDPATFTKPLLKAAAIYYFISQDATNAYPLIYSMDGFVKDMDDEQPKWIGTSIKRIQ